MININKVKRYSVATRKSKVIEDDFAKAPAKGRSFAKFVDSFPNILKSKEIQSIANDIVKAKKSNKAVIFMGGAHVIKCGLNPVLIELMRKKAISAVCLNGAGIIHDFEIALQGKTSEDVAANLKAGAFGMAKEAADFINCSVEEGVSSGLGLGNAVAKAIHETKLPHKKFSLLNCAYERTIPVYVFVALGTDIIHQHPSFNAALTGEGSIRDFYGLAGMIPSLNRGGVVLNFGSAVIMPEVFLKALNLARNLGSRVKDFTTANFDMIYQYRPQQNVVSRPVMGGGKGYYIVGHHEIMLPFLAQMVVEKL
jgi:hypothetical protein